MFNSVPKVPSSSLIKSVSKLKSMHIKTKLPVIIIFRQIQHRLLSKTSSSTNNNCSSVSSGNIFQQKDKMPVITAVAVAAHRQNHHMSTSPPNETHAQLVYRRFRLLSCGSALDIPKTTTSLLRTSSFNGCCEASNNKGGMIQPLHPIQDFMRRNYAKGNYAKGKDKTKKSIVTINEEEMAEIVDVDSLKKQLDKLMEQMKEEFSKQLSIRGASGALETLTVEFEGDSYPLQELAQVGRKNPQLAVLNLGSLPDAIQPVLKAIRDSGMNLNPQQEGTTIYVALPKVTREHRENLAKNAKTIFNKYKTNFQVVQNKFIKQVKSQKDASEDLSFRVQQQVMKLAESYIADAEKLLNSKQSELLEIK